MKTDYPAVRELVLAGSVIPFAFLSDEINGLLPDPTEFAFPTWPKLPGFKAIDLQIRGLWTALQATTVTAAPTISIGTNAPDFDDMLPSTDALPTDDTRATTLLTPGGGTFLGDQSAIDVNSHLPDLATPPRILLIDPATGTGFTQCRFRILVQGCLAKLPTIDLD